MVPIQNADGYSMHLVDLMSKLISSTFCFQINEVAWRIASKYTMVDQFKVSGWVHFANCQNTYRYLLGTFSTKRDLKGHGYYSAFSMVLGLKSIMSTFENIPLDQPPTIFLLNSSQIVKVLVISFICYELLGPVQGAISTKHAPLEGQDIKEQRLALKIM